MIQWRKGGISLKSVKKRKRGGIVGRRFPFLLTAHFFFLFLPGLVLSVVQQLLQLEGILNGKTSWETNSGKGEQRCLEPGTVPIATGPDIRSIQLDVFTIQQRVRISHHLIPSID